MPTEDRRVGKLLPSPVTPASTVCYTIEIPNAVPYRAAFLGQLDVLGRADTWDHPRDGTVCSDCEEAAQIWRSALYNASFSDDCETDMSCLDVAECITSDSSVAEAIAALMANDAAIQIILQNAAGANVFGDDQTLPGFPLTAGQMAGRLNEIDECAFDAYWAQVDQFIDYLLDLGQDTLDKLALYTTALAAGTATGKMAGLIAKLKNGTTAGKVTEFLNWAAGTMKTAYEAADDTANRNAIKCALFCANRDECLITLDGLGATLNERLGGALDPSSITSLAGLAETIVTITFDPSLALDLWLTFLLGTAKTAGILGMEGIDETIQLMLKVAVNDANDDWRTLCDECDTVPGWQAYGTIGVTTVVKSGNVYTITHGFVGPFGNAYIYVGSSVDGVSSPSVGLEYTGLNLNGVTVYDWGSDEGNFTTVPPNAAPPPKVSYAGGATPGVSPSTLSIVFETELPFQGLVAGA